MTDNENRGMGSSAHNHLLGTYRTPRFTYGSVATCEVRGHVTITGLSNGRIPWPVGKRGNSRARALVVYGGLAQAVRRESATAVCYWWGVTPQTVSRWRKEMGVGPMTEGTTRLKVEVMTDNPGVLAGLAKAWKKARDPKRCEKIAASKRGKPRPDHVVEAMRKGRTGKPHPAEAREKMSEAQRTRVRVPGRTWTREENQMLGEMPDAEVARRTNRSPEAVRSQRRKRAVGRFEG